MRSTDLRGGRGQPAFGAAHIRTLTQQAGGVAQRQRACERRHAACHQGGIQRIGLLPQQHRQTMAVLRFGGFQQRNIRFDRLQPRQAALHIQLAAGAQVPARLREFLGVAQIGQGALGDVELLLGAAQLEVIARHFRGDGDLHVLQVGLLCIQIGACGFRRATLATEQVQFPGRIQTERGLLGKEALVAGDHLLLLAAIEAALCGDVRGLVETALHKHRACLLHPRHRNAQVVVGEQRIAHQLFQHRVVELRPPVADRRFGAEGRVLRALQRDRGGWVGPVIRPHRATAEHQRGQRRAEQCSYHGKVSPRWV